MTTCRKRVMGTKECYKADKLCIKKYRWRADTNSRCWDDTLVHLTQLTKGIQLTSWGKKAWYYFESLEAVPFIKLVGKYVFPPKESKLLSANYCIFEIQNWVKCKCKLSRRQMSVRCHWTCSWKVCYNNFYF